MPQPPDAIRVDRSELRRMFNDAGFFEKVQRGQLLIRRRRHTHCVLPPPGEPPCTHSDIFVYGTLDGRDVALVHQYTRRDGSVGASGLPDPYWIEVERKRYWASVITGDLFSSGGAFKVLRVPRSIHRAHGALLAGWRWTSSPGPYLPGWYIAPLSTVMSHRSGLNLVLLSKRANWGISYPESNISALSYS